MGNNGEPIRSTLGVLISNYGHPSLTSWSSSPSELLTADDSLEPDDSTQSNRNAVPELHQFVKYPTPRPHIPGGIIRVGKDVRSRRRNDKPIPSPRHAAETKGHGVTDHVLTTDCFKRMEADTKSKCLIPPTTSATVMTEGYTGPRRTNQPSLGNQLTNGRPISHPNGSVLSLEASSPAAARPQQLSRTTSTQAAMQPAEYSGQPGRHMPPAQTDQFLVGYCEQSKMIKDEVFRRYHMGKQMLDKRHKECLEKMARLYQAPSHSSDTKLIDEEFSALTAELSSIAEQTELLDETFDEARRKPIPDFFQDHVSLKTETRKLQATNAAKDSKISELQVSSSLKDRKIEELQAENSAKDDEIGKKTTTIVKLEKEMVVKETKIVELEKEKADSKKGSLVVKKLEEQRQVELEDYRKNEAKRSQEVSTLLKNTKLLSWPPFHQPGDLSMLPPGLSMTPAKRQYDSVSAATAQDSVDLKPQPNKKVKTKKVPKGP